MKEVEITIPTTVFPNQFVSDTEKATVEYGLMIGNAIQWEWFSKDQGSCRFYDRMGRYHRLRMYARGSSL